MLDYTGYIRNGMLIELAANRLGEKDIYFTSDAKDDSRNWHLSDSRRRSFHFPLPSSCNPPEGSESNSLDENQMESGEMMEFRRKFITLSRFGGHGGEFLSNLF